MTETQATSKKKQQLYDDSVKVAMSRLKTEYPSLDTNKVKYLEQNLSRNVIFGKFYDKDGNFLCEDNCESLGKWPVYFRNDLFHIDTSSFAVRRDVAVRIGHSWYGQWGADRQFFNALKKNFPQYESTNQYTCCYRLDGNENSVNREFFDEGNAVNEKKYGGNFPWKSGKRLITIGPGISIVE